MSRKFKHFSLFSSSIDPVHFRKTYQSDILFPPLKYFSEQILVALARNPLNMLVIVLESL